MEEYDKNDEISNVSIKNVKQVSENCYDFSLIPKYLFVYDTDLEKQKFDIVKFEFPEGVKSIKIATTTTEFSGKCFESVLYGKNDANL